MFRKLLIANRGEIAIRIIRACRELGIVPVAVYSEADRGALHVQMADEAYPIGPAPAAKSYLDRESLLKVARSCGADALHPGVGFLAESHEFASLLAGTGVEFVGPPAEAIRAMGDKTEARTRMEAAGVPIVPGSVVPLVGEAAAAEADRIGFPLMLKAVAGGGGKGMRIVPDAQEFPAALRAARGEARQAFGDDRVYLERFLPGPRHIEIQVLADGHGTVVHLGERECSIQRRHQKLIEEAPSPRIDAKTRARMGEVAVKAARAVDYRGAGTVEFLYSEGDFFFLEMNTRLQVEHPVTECVTGVDLVIEQIRIAADEPCRQAPAGGPLGHAIECRINGEDPFNHFLPSVGTIEALRVPSGPGVRWDGGIAEGFEVGLHYDPLLAKLIVHASTRERAIRRMRRALRELVVEGVSTTQPYHLAVMDEPDFRAGRLSTAYVESHPELTDGAGEKWREEAALAAAVVLEDCRRRKVRSGPAGAIPNGARTALENSEWSEWQRLYAPE